MPIQGEEDKDTDASPTYRGFLDLIISRSLILACVMISFAFELLAAYSYFSYWPCSKIVGKCSPAGAFSWLPLSIAWIVGQAFCIVDIVLLFASICVVKICGLDQLSTLSHLRIQSRSWKECSSDDKKATSSCSVGIPP